MQLELLCKCWQTATCETAPNNPSSEHCYVLLRGSQSAAKVVDVHLKRHSPSIFGHVLCTQVWELLLGKCTVNGGGVAESENCYFNSVHSSSSLSFPPPPPPFGLNLKRSRRSTTPIKTVNVVSFAACLCPAAVLETAAPRPTLSFSCSLATKRPPVSKKKTPRSNTARVWLFLKQPVLGPALCQFTSHNTRFKQPNSCGFGPSQNTLVESPNVFLARPEPRQPEHNDIFRDRPWLSKKQCFWQMSQSAITKKKKIKIHRARGTGEALGEREREKAGYCGF